MKTIEYENLMLRILSELARTRRSERIKLHARILTQSMILDNAKYRSNVEDILILCSDLTESDLVLARAIYEQQKGTPLDFGGTAENEYSYVESTGYKKLQKITNLDDAAFQLSLTKLVRAGLLQQTTPREEYPALHRITRSFRNLMSFIGQLE